MDPFTILGIVFAATVLQSHAITQLDFYPSNGKGDILRQGDTEFEMVKLEPAIPFYSQTYDHIYVRTGSVLVGCEKTVVEILGIQCVG